MNISKTPFKYTTSENPVIFGLSGSSLNTRLFQINLKEVVSDSTFYTGKAYPTPSSPTTAYINLSNQLSSVIRTDIDNTDEIVISKTIPIINYYMDIIEYGIAFGALSYISSATSETYFAYQAKLNNVYWTKTFNENTFIMYEGDTGNEKFLTFRENNIKVNEYSNEQLYFIKSGDTEMRVFVEYIDNTGEYGYEFDVPVSGVTIPEQVAYATVSSIVMHDSTHMYVEVIEPIEGSKVLVDGVRIFGATPYELTNALVLVINLNTYGYFASYVSDNVINIYARSGLGDTMNGYPAYINDQDYSGYAESTFQNGENPSYTTSNMCRIQTSPKKLAMSGATFLPGYFYTVKVIDTYGVPISETKTYTMEETDCNVDYVNLFFSNSVGGIDSIQLTMPKVTFLNNKQTIKKNPLNAEGEEVFITDGVYNSEKQIYANTLTTTISMYTKPLTDVETEWLVELINSRNIYLELNNGDLIPVVLVNNDYQMKKIKYNKTELIQYEFIVELPSNFYNVYNNDISIINNY